MESLSLEMVLMLFFIALAAGTVDAIAGGGGLLALPALLWVGLPPALALGTTKLQGSFGTLSASLNYINKGIADPREMKTAILATFLGSVTGAILVQVFNPAFLAGLIPFLLIGTALYFAFSPKVGDVDARQRMGQTLFSWMIGAGIGFYDGFFGPGAGAFFALAHVSLLGFNLAKATAHSKVLNLTSNLSALFAFIAGGSVVWSLGLIMALGQFLGGRLGSNLVISHGAKLVRPLLIIVSLAMTAKLILDDQGGVLKKLLADWLA